MSRILASATCLLLQLLSVLAAAFNEASVSLLPYLVSHVCLPVNQHHPCSPPHLSLKLLPLLSETLSPHCFAEAWAQCRAVGFGWEPLTQQRKQLWHMMLQRVASGVSWPSVISLKMARQPRLLVAMCQLFLNLQTLLLVRLCSSISQCVHLNFHDLSVGLFCHELQQYPDFY